MCNCHEKTGKEKSTEAKDVREPAETSKCEAHVERVNAHLGNVHAEKVNSLLHCDGTRGCSCGGEISSEGAIVDLIVLIDTSESMEPYAALVSGAVAKALDAAKARCRPDLKVTFLGIDEGWPGTLFTQGHREYLYGLHGSGIPLAVDRLPDGYPGEEGANAIEDLSKYNVWREGACRAIFYISDEELDGIKPREDFAHETAETQLAIHEAQANNVQVFANLIRHAVHGPEIHQNYTDLCVQTGGEAYFSDTPSEEGYIKLLETVICNACGVSRCKPARIPKLQPCISIRWGDSKCDCLETSDYEVLTIEVCNCYTDIGFSNFRIGWIQVLDEDGGPVPTLPDGTPSVKVTPIGPYCFGTIAPCSCVAREFVLFTEGAKPGKYRLQMAGICFDVTQSQLVEECFEFSLCKS